MKNLLLFEDLAQRHIVLNNKWEENVIRYKKLNIRKVDEGIESYNLPELVLEQWLYSDLRESTRSSLNIPANANSTNGGKPAILQLVSVVDISDSFYSQYRKIVDLSKDDSEFHDPSENPREQVKTKHGTKDINNFFGQSPKKPMYMYGFSDGNIIIKAVASDKIHGLDFTTYLGAKVLFIQKYVCRNRVVKLTSKNCQFLGGCNERCMEENSNPLKAVCQKLGKNYEEAVLQASSRNQLNQTMKAAAILQPQSTVVQAMKAPQPLQKPQPAVVQDVQPQQPLIQPPPKTDTSMTTLIEPPPLQKETLQSTLKKPEPKKLQEGNGTCVSDNVKHTTAINAEIKSINASNEQSLDDSVVNISSSFSSLRKRQPTAVAAVNHNKQFNIGSTTKSLHDTSFFLTDNFFSSPSPPKFQPPKPPAAINNDISNFDISDTTLNDYGSAGKSNFLKPSSIQKTKQTILKPKITTMPPLNVQVDDDGFKRPLPFVRRSNNVNLGVDRMSPPKKNPKLDNDGFKMPFLPARKPAPVQRPITDDFVPETPAAVYNAIKPSEVSSQHIMGPKKLLQPILSSSKSSQCISVFTNELPFKTKSAVAALKKERSSPPKPSLNPFSVDDTVVARDPVNNIFDDNDVQMNNSNTNEDSDDNSQPRENTGKSFSELLAINSETEFMKAIQANKPSQNRHSLREKQSQNISALPWKPITKSLSPLYGSQKFNFSQSSDRLRSQQKSREIDAARSKEEIEDESPTQNLPKNDAFNLGKSNDGMDRKIILSNRQKIHPTQCEINSEFLINKWSLLVKVSTETRPNVVMVVGKELLTSLLGFTQDHLKKAMAEKNTYELDRCKEKAQKLRKIFERQDLVLEIEIPSLPSSYPVIKKIKKLSSAPNNV
uniref:RecQ-mediated genome instability protein 1 n=1 Tax=Panagrolaimus davidi TaxID=227884 RepID=A0A914QM35_9BILA